VFDTHTVTAEKKTKDIIRVKSQTNGNTNHCYVYSARPNTLTLSNYHAKNSREL